MTNNYFLLGVVIVRKCDIIRQAAGLGPIRDRLKSNWYVTTLATLLAVSRAASCREALLSDITIAIPCNTFQ